MPIWKPKEGDGITLEISKGPITAFYLMEGERVLASIEFLQIDEETYEGVWAETQTDEGHGPAIYEIAMTYLYPAYVQSSRTKTSPSSFKVWEKFYKRPDVERKVTTPHFDVDGQLPEDKTVVNYKYRKSNPAYKNLIKNALIE